MSVTATPRAPSNAASVVPPGPPPTITTSHRFTSIRSTIDHDFPSDGPRAPFVSKIARAQRCVDPTRIVNENSKCRSLEPHDRIDTLHRGTHPPNVSRIDETDEPACVVTRPCSKRFHVRVAADDTIERDDVSGRNCSGDLDKIALNESHPIRVPPSFRLGSCYGEIIRRGVDMSRGRNPVLEQLVMNRADSATNVEQRQAVDATGFEVFDQQRSRANGTFLSKPSNLFRRGFRPELLLDSFALMAAGHAR